MTDREKIAAVSIIAKATGGMSADHNFYSCITLGDDVNRNRAALLSNA